MFVKLRNKFIFSNLLITTVVLFIAFSAIFIIFAANSRPTPRIMNSDPNVRVFIESRLAEQANASLGHLALSLIVTFLSTELLVLGVSFFIAEQSIKPIREAYEQQKTFIANASHELKTPVAAIAANLEALESEVPTKNWGVNMHSELDKASDLLRSLLALAAADDALTDERLTKVKLGDLIDKTLEPFTLRAKQKGIVIEKTLPARSKSLELPKLALTSVLEILLDNAVKYAEKNITVSVSATEISVINDGPTIPAAKLSHIFDRFYQVDKSSEGSGLGLSIAHAISEKYAWTLSATSNKNKTTFTLKV